MPANGTERKISEIAGDLNPNYGRVPLPRRVTPRRVLARIADTRTEGQRGSGRVCQHAVSKSALVFTCMRGARYGWLIKSGRALRGRRRDRPQDTG